MKMDKERLEAKLIDYIDGKLTERERNEIEQELIRDEHTYKLYEQLKEVMTAMDHSKPTEAPVQMKQKFEASLQEEIASTRRKESIFLHPATYRIAAAVALLILGGGIGFWINTHNRHQQEIAAIKKEMEATKSMMMALIDNSQSASQRIQGVNVALSIKSMDEDVVRALAKTLRNDPNTNVRLAALDALSKFHEDPTVRKILIEALGRQKDPVVQIALIQLMVKMKERGIVNDLQHIVDDDQTMKAVKDEAYSGLLKLS
jgi:hypothetical protein